MALSKNASTDMAFLMDPAVQRASAVVSHMASCSCGRCTGQRSRHSTSCAYSKCSASRSAGLRNFIQAPAAAAIGSAVALAAAAKRRRMARRGLTDSASWFAKENASLRLFTLRKSRTKRMNAVGERDQEAAAMEGEAETATAMEPETCSFLDVLKANGGDKRLKATAQDRVFNWLGRAPQPGSDCFEALQKYFPGALPGAAVHLRSKAILQEKYGMTPKDTLLGTSFCPDEINNHEFDLPTLMRNYWGNVFPMGGIGGSPFVGETGFKAFSSHVAEDGNIIVVFGPHVGISEDGKVGEYLRAGQAGSSTACGAVIGAYKACLEASEDAQFDSDVYDMQMDEIKNVFVEHANDISAMENPMAACAYQAFCMVRERIRKIVNTKFGSGKLVLIGGIQINMPQASMDDHFLPLMFEVQQAGAPTEDLLSHFDDIATQQDLEMSPGAATTAQREVFSFMTWSPPAESPVYKAMHKYFPGALPSQALHERKRAILRRYGLTAENTIMATSLCPDEINNDPSDLPVIMQKHWGDVFPMGGIGGAPFVGKTGFNAFASHVPDDGNIIILFGPHVAISEDGEVGACLRAGQSGASSACGAVIGAYNAALSGQAEAGADPSAYDKQMDWIISQIAPHAKSIKDTENPMASLSHQSFQMVKDKLFQVVNNDFGSGYLVLVGGIQINMPDPLEDHFYPCTLELRKAGEPTIDLLDELKEFLVYPRWVAVL